MHMLRLYLYVGNVVLSYSFRGGKETFFKYMLLMLYNDLPAFAWDKIGFDIPYTGFVLTHSHDTGFSTNINGVGD